ncbi:MAG TPA: metallophosphoesterase, partial [Rhodocyclaceae bacterium]|nr:metallophosphoesterase [Rhodocyclaceae bacterium]
MRRVRFLLTVVGLFTLLHAYIGWRLLPALPIGDAGRLAGVALLALSATLIPAGMLARFYVPRPLLADRLTWVGSLLMGLFSSLLVLTVLRDLVLALVPAKLLAGDTAILVPSSALLVTLIGFVNARRPPRLVEVDIPIAGLPPALAGFSIVQISDIHVGATIKADYVQAIVDQANGLDADLIAITGDVVDGSVERLAPHTAPLAGLRARHGCYFVTGNHEYYSGAADWVAEFRRLGLRVLMNEHEIVEHGGARLLVAGVTDYSAQLFDPTQGSDPRAALAGAPAEYAPRILLAHQPRSASAAAAVGFDLQLSGHTHGGQFWPWNHFVRLQQPYTAGLHRLDKLWIYTSRGAG